MQRQDIDSVVADLNQLSLSVSLEYYRDIEVISAAISTIERLYNRVVELELEKNKLFPKELVQTMQVQDWKR